MKVLMDDIGMQRSLKRITHEIVEKNKGVENVVLVGLVTRGVNLAERIAANIKMIEGVDVPVFPLNVGYWRDDEMKVAEKPEENYDFSGKKVIIVDDVLYKGRTVRAAMEGVIAYGRPKQIQLAVLVDRGHRELPIRADYVGKNIPTAQKERVSVKVASVDGVNQVILEGE